jgi:hypothetical protein
MEIVRSNAHHNDQNALNPVYGGKGFREFKWFIGRRYRRQTVIRRLEAGDDDADRPFAHKYDKWCVSNLVKSERLGFGVCSYSAHF